MLKILKLLIALFFNTVVYFIFIFILKKILLKVNYEYYKYYIFFDFKYDFLSCFLVVFFITVLYIFFSFFCFQNILNRTFLKLLGPLIAFLLYIIFSLKSFGLDLSINGVLYLLINILIGWLISITNLKILK